MAQKSRIRCRFRQLTTANDTTASTAAFLPNCSAWGSAVRCGISAGLLGLRLIPASRSSSGSVQSAWAFPRDAMSDVFRGNIPPFGTRLFSGTALGLSGALITPRTQRSRGGDPDSCGTSPLCFPDSSPKASLGPCSRKRVLALGAGPYHPSTQRPRARGPRFLREAPPGVP